MSLRKRLENSDTLAAALAWLLAGYLRLCFRTIRWQKSGLEELASALREGPIILVLWHQRLMIGPSAWPQDLAELYTLRDPSPAGRLSSHTQTRLGMRPVMMHANASNLAASRKILRLIREGHSLGLTADGPEGPAREAKQAAVEWARATGRPVFVFAWSARHTIRLKTWDRLMIPLPFSRGAYGYRRWEEPIGRRLSPQAYADLRQKLSASLDEIARQMDTAASRST